MPRFVKPLVAILVALTLVPLALTARACAARSSTPPLHLVFDMDQQAKYRAQSANPVFADGRAMRPPIPGTVARGELDEDDALFRGKVGGEYVTEFPVPVTGELLARGRERFAIYCAPCHGLSGDGRGPVAVRAAELEEGTWTPPSSYAEEPALSRPVGHLYNTIVFGARNMAAYGPQIPVLDRWAIVAWIRVLMRSQHATIEDVPEEHREALR